MTEPMTPDRLREIERRHEGQSPDYDVVRDESDELVIERRHEGHGHATIAVMGCADPGFEELARAWSAYCGAA